MPLKRHATNEIEARRLYEEKIKPQTRILVLIPGDECHEFSTGPGDSRGTCQTPSQHQGISYRANRVAYAAHWGDIEADDDINFRCGNPKCVNPHHLTRS